MAPEPTLPGVTLPKGHPLPPGAIARLDPLPTFRESGEFQQPLDFRWDRIVDEEGRTLQATTVDGARPLTREEMDRIRNAPYKLPAANGARGEAKR